MTAALLIVSAAIALIWLNWSREDRSQDEDVQDWENNNW